MSSVTTSTLLLPKAATELHGTPPPPVPRFTFTSPDTHYKHTCPPKKQLLHQEPQEHPPHHRGKAQAPPAHPLLPPSPVGNTSPTQKEPTPFIIEWIPNILPHSHIGELRIKFEYGHQGGRQPQASFSTQQPPALEPTLELAPLTTITFP